MPALQIRDLPESIHSLLVERARKERRSVAQEATVLLAKALAVDPLERRREILAEARMRKPVNLARITTPEDLIRQDRSR